MSKTESKSEASPSFRYVNRELSWLAFNQRVLDQAFNSSIPLLERVKFLAITATNLDEFFRVRIGGLKFAGERGSSKTGIAGMNVQQQLERIRETVSAFNQSQYGCLLDELLPKMEQQGIRRVTLSGLDVKQRVHLDDVFQNRIHPLLEMIAAGGGGERKFPWLDGLRLCLCVRFGSGTGICQEVESDSGTGSRYIVIPVPVGKHGMNRFIPLPAQSGYPYILLEDVIAMHLQQLFPAEKIEEYASIRVIRNADFELNEEADDFFQEMEQLLSLRDASDCVRLEISEDASPAMNRFLAESLNVTAGEVYTARGPLALGDFHAMSRISGFSGLKDPAWNAAPSPGFPADAGIFEIIADADRILVHPYQSYDPVIRLVEEAAIDPKVLTIKQTLYRTSRDSRIVRAMGMAAENGKSVTAVVELKARFDEERNMGWAKQMQQSGVNVIYGVRGLKTHAKLCLIVRDEPTGLRRYAHFGTGNYNETTAGLYGDISYFTCDPQLTGDALNAFNSITGLTVPQPMEKLAMAPVNLRAVLLDLIRIEKDNAAGGLEAAITAKLNSLVDQEIIDALYEASSAGVQIRLNVRGICCLRPGVEGLSRNIQVISIVDRYLEHARVFKFRQGGDNRMFISSADWMGRNLDKRIELMVPIDDPSCRSFLDYVLESCFRDNVSSWTIQQDGTSRRASPGRRGEFRSQQELWEWCQQLHQNATNPGTTVFKPILPE